MAEADHRTRLCSSDLNIFHLHQTVSISPSTHLLFSSQPHNQQHQDGRTTIPLIPASPPRPKCLHPRLALRLHGKQTNISHRTPRWHPREQNGAPLRLPLPPTNRQAKPEWRRNGFCGVESSVESTEYDEQQCEWSVAGVDAEKDE